MLIFSDLHGCYYTFLRLLAKCPSNEQIVFCGDLIDRGPHSREMIEYAMEHKVPTVCGNHEDMALYWHGRVESSLYGDPAVWCMNGGMDTLKSWMGTPLPRDPTKWRLPDDVLDWMQALPYYLEYDGLLVSHTGHGKTKGKGGSEYSHPLWRRDTQFPDDGVHRVFGHTQETEPVLTESWSKIDTGAAYKGRGMGTMTAFHWPSKQVIQQVYNESP